MMCQRVRRAARCQLAVRSVAGPTRRGLTLLEVIIALLIFLIALAPIMTLVSMGGERALDIQQQAQASMLCQAKLDGVKVGADPKSGGGTVDMGNLTWNYTIESTDTDVTNLYQIKVTVKFDRADGKTVEASLTQLMFDPAFRGSTLAAPTGSMSSSSSSSGGN